jgi:hypothetical protein
VSVLLTLAVLAIVGVWALTVIRRVSALREQVKLAWKRLEVDQSNEAIKSVYNKHVTLYNNALESFPAYLIAPLAGLKPARPFNP